MAESMMRISRSCARASTGAAASGDADGVHPPVVAPGDLPGFVDLVVAHGVVDVVVVAAPGVALDGVGVDGGWVTGCSTERWGRC